MHPNSEQDKTNFNQSCWKKDNYISIPSFKRDVALSYAEMTEKDAAKVYQEKYYGDGSGS